MEATQAKQVKTASTVQCGGCGKFLTGGATCSKCKSTFHKKCVNITSITPKNWQCPGCVVSTPRQDNTNTPIKVQDESSRSPSPLLLDSKDDPQGVLLEEVRALRADMNSFRKEFGNFRKEISDEIKDLRIQQKETIEKMDLFAARLDSQESRLDSQESKLEAISKEAKDLKVEVSLLKREIQERDQMALSNDLEISGVTESNGESCFQIIGILAAKLGVKLEERDVVDVHRVGPVRVGMDGKPRARPIALRVARRALRDQLMRAARSRRGLTTADIEVAGAPRPIFTNERLTKENRLLFVKGRALCKEHSWKYAWTRDGKVFIRKVDGEPAFRIRDEKELSRIFKL